MVEVQVVHLAQELDLWDPSCEVQEVHQDPSSQVLQVPSCLEGVQTVEPEYFVDDASFLDIL
ncbi:MAG: hypothetical protein CMJ52_00010 [Planctomycetaceae bacterium]|nr:hypothetical protein [Planctomycetaceae bacterium]